MQAERVRAAILHKFDWAKLLQYVNCRIPRTVRGGGILETFGRSKLFAVCKMQDSTGRWIQYCACLATGPFRWHPYTSAFASFWRTSSLLQPDFLAFAYILMMQLWKSRSLHIHCFNKIMHCSVFAGDYIECSANILPYKWYEDHSCIPKIPIYKKSAIAIELHNQLIVGTNTAPSNCAYELHLLHIISFWLNNDRCGCGDIHHTQQKLLYGSVTKCSICFSSLACVFAVICIFK